MEEQQILRWNRIEESFSLSQVHELIPEGVGLVLPVSGMEKQQILRWNRIEESSSPSQVIELIPEGAGLVLPCLGNGGAADSQDELIPE
jgi:hypothetical protein